MDPRWEGMTTQELFRELRRTGDTALRTYLIEAHEGLVRHVARGYVGIGESYDDIVSVGHVGLVNAVDRFDPDRGTRFATFAVPTIKGEIRRYFRDRTWGIRVPRRIQELSLRSRQLIEKLTQQQGKSPSYAELADALGVAEEEVIEAVEVGRQYDLLSVEGTNSENGEAGQGILERTGEPDEDIELLGERDEIKWALNQLGERERLIVVLRFYMGMSQQMVGERLGISQMHVSRLQQRALMRLRQLLSR